MAPVAPDRAPTRRDRRGRDGPLAAPSSLARRLRQVADGRLRAERLLALDDAVYRNCGLSRQKTASLRDLSEAVLTRRLVPDQLWRLDDEEVVERVVSIRGLGPWSADMFLLFGLGRPDVWATGDLGLRRGLQVLDGLDAPPSVPTMIARAERWRPWRGLASLALWRLLEPGTVVPLPTRGKA